MTKRYIKIWDVLLVSLNLALDGQLLLLSILPILSIQLLSNVGKLFSPLNVALTNLALFIFVQLTTSFLKKDLQD